MPKKRRSKTYIVYDAQAMTPSLADARIVFSTHDQHEALAYARKYYTTVYAYERGADGTLSNATWVSDAADATRETPGGGREEPLDRGGA